jgi:hypothetical protein
MGKLLPTSRWRSSSTKDARALCARGLAKRRNGVATGGDADMAAAKALDPDVDKRM